ncbi:MAG TPA: hypothetical protein VMM78_17775 [Thermomicrobiales bacterium]|nr:hypothetical protein [Thermomicrobiales bacterium]
MDDIEIDNDCTVEWLILGDFAEVLNGKLYLMGGGWDVISVTQSMPTHRTVGVAVAVRIPWNRTNEAHTLVVEIQDDDARSTLARIDGQLEVGRPPRYPKGQAQRIQIALNIPLRFDHAGGYTVIGRVDDEQETRAPFLVDVMM